MITTVRRAPARRAASVRVMSTPWEGSRCGPRPAAVIYLPDRGHDHAGRESMSPFRPGHEYRRGSSIRASMARSGSLRTTGLGRVPSSGGLRPVIPRSHAIAAASSLECASPSSSKDNHPDARSRQTLHPDVFLGDCAVAPFCDGHHPAAAFELSDHARPLSGSEFDRVELIWMGVPPVASTNARMASMCSWIPWVWACPWTSTRTSPVW